MGYLNRLLAAAVRCAGYWHDDNGAVTRWHTCTLPPGHRGGHACPCGARTEAAA